MPGLLGTFHPLFPDTAYSGKLGLVGPGNVIGCDADVSIRGDEKYYTDNDLSTDTTGRVKESHSFRSSASSVDNPAGGRIRRSIPDFPWPRRR